MCHMYFKCVHRVETQQNIELMAFALTWCANTFVGCSLTPLFFIISLAFLILYIVLKIENLYVRSFNDLSYNLQIGSNCYMDTGVHDLEVAFFLRLILLKLMTRIKDLSNRPIYAVLNTHDLDMILQLKDIPTVMNPAKIASSN